MEIQAKNDWLILVVRLNSIQLPIQCITMSHHYLAIGWTLFTEQSVHRIGVSASAGVESSLANTALHCTGVYSNATPAECQLSEALGT